MFFEFENEKNNTENNESDKNEKIRLAKESKEREHERKIEEIFHIERRNKVRTTVFKLLTPFDHLFKRSYANWDLSMTSYHSLSEDWKYEKTPLLLCTGKTLKKLGLGLDLFVVHEHSWYDTLESVKHAIENYKYQQERRLDDYDYCDFSIEYKNWIIDTLKKEISQDKRTVDFCRWGYEYYLKHVNDDIDLMIESLNVYGDVVFDNFICMLTYLDENTASFIDYGCIGIASNIGSRSLHFFFQTFFNQFDPRVVFTIAKLKENGYKNLIERNQEEADLFYGLSFLAMTSNWIRQSFSAKNSSSSDISPLYRIDCYNNCRGDLLYFDIEEFLEKYESLHTELINRLFLTAELHTKKGTHLEEYEKFVNPFMNPRNYFYRRGDADEDFDFAHSLDIEPIYYCYSRLCGWYYEYEYFDNALEYGRFRERKDEKKVSREKFERTLKPLLEQEIACCFGFIFLQRKEYEKAKECFRNAELYDDWVCDLRSRHNVLNCVLSESEDILILCNLVYVELAIGAYYHKKSKHGYCPRLTNDFSDESFSGFDYDALSEAKLRLDVIMDRDKFKHLPIEADLFFQTNVVNEKNYQYPRDVYIYCQQNTLRGKHFPFECIGWSLFEHPNSSQENIGEICDIIHHKKGRDREDEIFLELFDGNFEKTHESKRKKYASLRMRPLASSRFKRINVHKKKRIGGNL